MSYSIKIYQVRFVYFFAYGEGWLGGILKSISGGGLDVTKTRPFSACFFFFHFEYPHMSCLSRKPWSFEISCCTVASGIKLYRGLEAIGFFARGSILICFLPEVVHEARQRANFLRSSSL